MNNDVFLRRLTKNDLPVYRDIYNSSFPEDERKTLAFMMSGPQADAYDLLVIGTADTAVAGLVILARHGGFILLDYFAVSPALRGRGIGHAALPLIAARCAERYPGAHLFLEIEVPCEDCPNPVERRRRKAFYLSAGLVETGVRARIYGSDMELLAYPADAPHVTRAAYAALLSATFPPDMVPESLKGSG